MRLVCGGAGVLLAPKTLLISLMVGLTPACAGGGDVSKDLPPKFKTTLKRDTDTVEVLADWKKTVFIVNSPFGISEVIIQRADAKWPDAVVVRLHLKGLENFRASNGKLTLDAGVSSQGGNVRLWKDGKEDVLLDVKSPFWMEIRMLASSGKPAKEIPLENGYFEMTLPKAFFEGNPKAITVTWVDFYR